MFLFHWEVGFLLNIVIIGWSLLTLYCLWKIWMPQTWSHCLCTELAAGLVHPTWFALVFLGMCFMSLKPLHRGSGGRLKSLHTAVVAACSCCRMGAPSSCGGALPAHICDSLAGVLGSPGRGTHLRFGIHPGEQHDEWRPAVRPVAGAPLCHDPVNGKSNTIPSTEELKY